MRLFSRSTLVLSDPGGQPLDRVLERDTLEQTKAQPLDPTRLLRLAINLALGLIGPRGSFRHPSHLPSQSMAGTVTASRRVEIRSMEADSDSAAL